MFNVNQLPLAAYAASLGLLTAPKVRFLKKAEKKRGETQESKKDKEKDKEGQLGEEKVKLDLPSDDDDGDDILIKKGSSVVDSMSTENLEEIGPRQPKGKPKTKVAKAKALLRKGIVANTKIVFDEEGNVESQEGVFEKHNAAIVDITPALDPSKAGGIDIAEITADMRAQDKMDKLEQKNKRKEAKHARKEKRRERDAVRSGGVATLGGDNSDSEEEEQEEEEEEQEEEEQGGDYSEDGASESESEDRAAKRFKSDNLQDTEELARQLLGDL